MTSLSFRVVAAARACLGARFRPGGRDPRYGLDCVGLAAHAIGAARPLPDPPRGYRLRGGRAADIVAQIDALGLGRATGTAAGALLLCEAGPAQLHLAIATGSGVIHADAAIGRVAERPGPPPWPVIAGWSVEAG